MEKDEDIERLIEKASHSKMMPLSDGRVFDGIVVLVRALMKLDKTTALVAESSERLAKRNLWLTWVIAALTFVIALLTIAQVLIAWWTIRR